MSKLKKTAVRRGTPREPRRHPKDPRETPQTANHDGTVALAACPWPWAGGSQHPWASGGTAKTAPIQNPEPRNKKGGALTKNIKTLTQFGSLSLGVLRLWLSEGFFR